MFVRNMLLSVAIVLYSATAFADFRAGVAYRVVTPEPLLPLVGGVGPSSPATETRGDLTVRAIVLEKGGTRVAICSTDFIGFPSPLCKKVRGLVRGVPAENILISATHTHSGPDTHGFPDGQGGTSVDMKYLNMVCKKLAEAINEAVGNLRPASIRVATDEVRGKIAYNYYAPMLYDPRCIVIQAIDKKGSIFATLVNYAIHPEILGNDRGIMSPDLVGPLYDRIKEKGGGMPIFINGAEGGMITADNRDYTRPQEESAKYFHQMRTWKECLRIGTLLADEALRIVEEAVVQSDPDLVCVAKTVRVPIDNPIFRAIVAASPIGYDLADDSIAPLQMNVVNLGNAQMLTIPGEALPNIGYYLKRKMHGEHNMILGLTNDHIGYILVKEDWDSFERYAYITRSCMGEMTGAILIKAGLGLVDAAPRPRGLPAD